jgi:hypothetical protein
MARRDWKRALLDWVDAVSDAVADALSGALGGEPALVPVPVKASGGPKRPAGGGRRDA